MTRESYIMHEAGPFWVCRERRDGTWRVMRDVGTHSVEGSGYPTGPGGLSLAIARCNHLAKAQGQLSPYAEELTPIGPQLVIPGCERKTIDRRKPDQLNLFA